MNGRVSVALILVVAVLACPLACLGGLFGHHDCRGGAAPSGHDGGCLNDPCVALAVPADHAQSWGSLDLEPELDLPAEPGHAGPGTRRTDSRGRARHGGRTRALPYHPSDVPLRL